MQTYDCAGSYIILHRSAALVCLLSSSHWRTVRTRSYHNSRLLELQADSGEDLSDGGRAVARLRFSRVLSWNWERAEAPHWSLVRPHDIAFAGKPFSSGCVHDRSQVTRVTTGAMKIPMCDLARSAALEPHLTARVAQVVRSGRWL